MLQQIKDKLVEKTEAAENMFKLLDDIHDFFYSNKETFLATYDELMPKITEENFDELVVFSHNDIQENNFIKNEQKIVIIDFEYSQLNFRGADLALYLMETSIEYTPNEYPGFRHHP